MRRRDFIKVVASSAIVWSPPARAQQPQRMRRIGVLMGWSEDDARSYFTNFTERLAQLGWVRERNVQIELHWTSANPERARIFAKELVASQPDVILCATTPVTEALFNETREIRLRIGSETQPPHNELPQIAQNSGAAWADECQRGSKLFSLVFSRSGDGTRLLGTVRREDRWEQPFRNLQRDRHGVHAAL